MSRKKPTEVHERDGTLRPDRQNHEEPRPEPGVPLMPHFFRDAEKAAWDRAVAMIQPLGVLTPSDGLALMSLAMRMVEVEELYLQIRDQRTIDVLSTQKEAVPRAHPLYPQWNAAMTAMRETWQAFGMDPISRTRVHTVKPKASAVAHDGSTTQGAVPSEGGPRRTAGSFFKH